LVYVTLGVLFATGLAWWWLAAGAAARVWLIALHGISAMLFLLLLGAVAVLHVRESWRRSRNRSSGTVVATAMAILVITALGLYYLGSDLWRGWTSDVHLLIGVAVPVLLAIHVVLGVRSRPNIDDED
jgi:hypothetical protein